MRFNCTALFHQGFAGALASSNNSCALLLSAFHTFGEFIAFALGFLLVNFAISLKSTMQQQNSFLLSELQRLKSGIAWSFLDKAELSLPGVLWNLLC